MKLTRFSKSVSIQSGRNWSGAGFGLLETFLVVGVLVIGLAISVPLVQGSLEAHRLKNSEVAMGLFINSARARAVSTNSRVRILFDEYLRTYRLEQLVNGVWTLVGAVESLPDGISFGNAEEIEFDSRGAADQAVDLTLSTTSGQVAEIKVSLAGQVILP